MKKYRLGCLGLLLAVVVSVAGCCAKQVKQSDNKGVQEAMNVFIQNKLSSEGGTYSIDGAKTAFDYLHSGVKEKEGFFVSCADFKDGSDLYDVDYYVKAEGGVYTVVKELYHKKNGEKVNKVIWQK